MNTTQLITRRIEKLPTGQIFSYTDFLKEPRQREAVIKALNRMVEAGKLAKLSKGKYYKAEQTVFGTLEPDQYQVVKDLLEDNGKVTGYLTGYSVYNKLGLTTQISNIIQIGKSDVRPQFMRGRYTIMFVRQKNVITKDNITLLQILDAIRYIKKIPDATLFSSTERLLAIVKDLTLTDKKKMVGLSIKYPASTRALLGAILDELVSTDLTMKLRDTLNPVTVYKMPGIFTILPKAINWNIK
ncbi:MAG TPA: DUF6088 family protein [Saprospiraceae bacterium]|nr:DUF6088 family protein [Saprospiraceae bacterium]